MKFTQEQMERYSRHILLPEMGGEGQRRLLESSVLVIGAGGLGSPALMYLAAAGVGRIGVVDSDTVDLSNLQRQILHTTDDLGRPKVESAGETLAALNPEVEITAIEVRLDAGNVRELIGDYDIVVDGSDNFPTRYLVNDACFFTKTPLVSGAVLRFEGQLSVFKMQGDGPCYRCLFPEPPPAGLVPSCQGAGVLGSVVGVIGALQATEVIKHLSQVGDSLEGTLLVWDALSMDFRRVRLNRSTMCPLCGEHPTITTLTLQGEDCSTGQG